MSQASPQSSSLALVVADSHTKYGALMQWIATEHGGEVKRLAIAGARPGLDGEVRSVEVVADGRRIEVVGLLYTALGHDGLALVLKNVERVVLVYSPQKGTAFNPVA